MNLGAVLFIVLLVFIFWNLYSDSQQKKWDGGAFFYSAIALGGVFLFYWLIEGTR